jgi:adenosylmethionine-8-amino-7-oxononanoate aminotransferase
MKQGSTAAGLIQRDRERLWHPYAPASPNLPLWEVEAADGVRLRLRGEDGERHEVVDAMSSWWSAIHGYRHPVLDAAAKRQLDSFSHVMFGGLTHAPAVELAERLVEMAPLHSGGRAWSGCSSRIQVRWPWRLRLSWRCSSRRRRGGHRGNGF